MRNQVISIIGTGRVAKALGPRLAQLGNQIIYGSREPNRQDVQDLLTKTKHGVQALNQKDACEKADIIVFAMPYKAMEATLSMAGDITEKIIIDITNALKMTEHGLMTMASDTSAGEELQLQRPRAKVVKAFNTVGFHIMANPAIAGGPVTVSIAGNDEDAKKIVTDLAVSLGFDTMDMGPISQSRFMEGMAALYMTPYLTGRKDEAFEFYLRKGSSPKKSEGIRAAL